MKIAITGYFKKQLKTLKKRYPHIKEDLFNKLISFKTQDEVYIGNSVYKTRIKSKDIPKGKSKSLRAYIYLYKTRDSLAPICIYSKSNKSTLSEKEIEHHVRETLKELPK
jgi:hypothetical protein